MPDPADCSATKLSYCACSLISVCNLSVGSACCRQGLPRVFASWLRCYLMCNVLYFVTGGMWAYYVYLCWGEKFFGQGNMPEAQDMWEQIKVTHVHTQQPCSCHLLCLWQAPSCMHLSSVLSCMLTSLTASSSLHVEHCRNTQAVQQWHVAYASGAGMLHSCFWRSNRCHCIICQDACCQAYAKWHVGHHCTKLVMLFVCQVDVFLQGYV